MTLHTRRFRCMTTDIELFLVADDARSAADALAAAEQFFYSVEARFSRFRADSELARLNATAGRPTPVSAELAELAQLSLSAAAASQGIFDPTVIDALEAAGYDRSIEIVREQGPQPRKPAPSASTSALISTNRWRGVQVDRRAQTVTLPAGLRLDLGGIAKGWAAEQAAALLRPFGAGLVNAGGDLAAWGDQPGVEPGQGWLAAVDDPAWPDRDVAWLWVRNGAVATSSVVSRRWHGSHHLIDPRTGQPAATDLSSVTVAAPSTAQAEIAAKVVLILGRKNGLAWLNRTPSVGALLCAANGDVATTPGLAESFAWLQERALADSMGVAVQL